MTHAARRRPVERRRPAAPVAALEPEHLDRAHRARRTVPASAVRPAARWRSAVAPGYASLRRAAHVRAVAERRPP
ncbi:hypothetical protein, partial [Streptomyces huiliensis]|uniref:hypothetical protein n=1 Tax=Streptomyces huiliensis TaxID=2876027 RepID=UPI001CC108D0